jgi:outer membrane protein OmpA-like peptidoglycan-associated protein
MTGSAEVRFLLYILAAAALVTGCAKPRNDLVVVLPEEGGKVGAVVVTDEKKRQTTLNTAYASARSDSPGFFDRSSGMKAGPSSADEVRQSFGTALAAQPARPVSLLLYFTEGSTLSDESKEVVDRMFAEIAKRPAAEITVIGHTDTIGNDAYNDKLSLERAQAVREILIGMGVPAQNITAAGRGRRELLVPTGDNVNEPRNRRVELNVR